MLYKGHRGPVNAVAFSKDGAYVLSGGQDRSVLLWNVDSGNRVQTYTGHGYEIRTIAVAHDSARFCSGGADKNVYVWDVASGNIVRRLAHPSRTDALAYNETSSVLASGSYDTHVRLWDMRAQQRSPLQTLSDARDAVTSISIHTSTIYTASVDGHVRSYDLRMGTLVSDYFDQPVSSISISSDNTTVLVSTLPSTLRLIDLSTGELLQTFRDASFTNENYRIHSTFTHNEDCVVAGDEKGQLLVWEVVDGKVVRRITSTTSTKSILWVERRPGKGGGIIAASADGTMELYRDI